MKQATALYRSSGISGGDYWWVPQRLYVIMLDELSTIYQLHRWASENKGNGFIYFRHSERIAL